MIARCGHTDCGICESCALDQAQEKEIAANGCSCGKPYVAVLVDTRTGREYFMCAGFTDLVIKMSGVDRLHASNTKSGPQAARPPVPTGDLLLEQQQENTPGAEPPSTDEQDT